MKYITAKPNKKNPSLLDFYIDEEKIENMFCLSGARIGKNSIEATARVVITKQERTNNENNSRAKTRVRVSNKQQQKSSSKRASKDDLPSTECDRATSAKEDEC